MAAYILIQAFIALLVIRALLKGRTATLWIAGFVAPLQGLPLYFGGSWTWSVFVSGALGVMLLTTRDLNRRPSGVVLLAGFFVWAMLATVWFGLLDPTASALMEIARIRTRWGVGQTSLRYIVQFGAFSLMILGVYATLRLVRSPEHLIALVRGFLVGNVLSIGAGLYQVAAVSLDWWWIRSPGEEVALQGNFGTGVYDSVQLAGSAVTRLYGFGGEPKHTAAFAVLAICVWMSFRLKDNHAIAPLKVVLLLTAGLFLTFSTSGWIGTLIVMAYLVVASGINLASSTRSNYARILRQLVLPLALVGFIGVTIGPQSREAIVQQRLTDRLGNLQTSARSYEWKDDAFYAYLADNPFRAVFGHGVGGVDFFLVPYAPSARFMESTITPTYALSRLLGDVGALGVGILVAIVLTWQTNSKESSARLFIGAGGIAFLFLPYIALGSYLLLAAGFAGSSYNLGGPVDQKTTGLYPLRVRPAAFENSASR